MGTTERDLTIGVFGCGNIAGIAWAPNFQRADVRTLFFDIDRAKAEAFAERFGGEAFRTPFDLLAQRPDGCVVATWAPTHFEMGMQVLSAGSHLLVEKPMTTDLADAKALLREAQARGLAIAQPYHQLLMLKDALDQARQLGQRTAVDYRWLRRAAAGPDANLLEDLGPHAFAMALKLVGYSGIESVAARKRDGVYFVWLVTRSVDVTIEIGSGLTMPREEEVSLRLGGRLGTLEAEMRTTLTPPDEQLDYRPRLALARSSRGPSLTRLARVLPVDEVRTQQANRWLSSLRGGERLPADGLVGLEAQALLDAAIASMARDGARVTPDALSEFR